MLMLVSHCTPQHLFALPQRRGGEMLIYQQSRTMVLIRHIWQHNALRGTEQHLLSRHGHIVWHCTVTIVQLIHTSLDLSSVTP
jgi:hypothetical protein